MTQQLVLEPLGIITEPNKLGQIPAGAMSSAVDVAIRSPGCIESIAGFTTFSAFTSDAGTTAAFVITPPGSAMVVIFNRTAGWFCQWINQSTGGLLGSAIAISFTLGGQPYPQSIRVDRQPGFSYVIHGKQLLVNMYSTVIVWDTYEPTTADERTPRPAGLFPPQLRQVETQPSPGTALAAGTYANYVAIYKRQVGDILMVSAPSPAVSTWMLVPADGDNVRLEVRMNEFVKAGDVLEIYRTKSKPTNGQLPAAFQRAEEAGAEYQKATSITLSASDVLLTSVYVIDSTADSSLGEALYTNQAVKGSAGAAALPPPALRFMTSHKGHVFGFGTTMPPSITLRPTGAWGSDFVDTAQAQSGLGSILLTGCTWSAGGPTVVVTVSPTSQLGFLKVGANVSTTGLSGNVAAIGGSTFTVTGTASGSGAGASVAITDVMLIDGNLLFASAWRFVPVAVAQQRELMLIAQSLKLPSRSGTNFDTLPVDGFTIRRKMLNDARTTFGVQSSGEKTWDPDVARYLTASTTPAVIEEKPRAMVWSEQNQPESWPFVQNDTFARGQPCAFASTRDCIIAFYTDSIWRISGTGGTAGTGYDWRADPIANNITICGSQALCVHNDIVYAMTSEGFVAIDSNGTFRNLTKGRVHDQLASPPWTDGAYTIATACFLIADEENGEILMREPSAVANVMWVYNIATDTFVHRTVMVGAAGPTHGDYSRFLRSPVTVGRDYDGEWKLSRYGTSGAKNVAVTYQPVYAENPFSQRQWQSVDLAAEPAANGNYFFAQCNGVATSSGGGRPLTNGRVSFEVPRNAPAIGNTMAITIFVDGFAGKTRILGVALNYVDQTERRRAR